MGVLKAVLHHLAQQGGGAFGGSGSGQTCGFDSGRLCDQGCDGCCPMQCVDVRDGANVCSPVAPGWNKVVVHSAAACAIGSTGSQAFCKTAGLGVEATFPVISREQADHDTRTLRVLGENLCPSYGEQQEQQRSNSRHICARNLRVACSNCVKVCLCLSLRFVCRLVF